MQTMATFFYAFKDLEWRKYDIQWAAGRPHVEISSGCMIFILVDAHRSGHAQKHVLSDASWSNKLFPITIHAQRWFECQAVNVPKLIFLHAHKWVFRFEL